MAALPKSAKVELSDDDVRDHVNDRPTPVATRPATSVLSHTMASPPVSRVSDERVAALEATVRELKDDLASIRDEFRSLQDQFEDLRRQLGTGTPTTGGNVFHPCSGPAIRAIT